MSEFISIENETFKLEIADKILNDLSKNFSYIKEERLKNYIENAAIKFSKDPILH